MMNALIRSLLLCVALTAALPSLARDVPPENRVSQPAATRDSHDVVGWVEFVTLEPYGVIAKAKLDTGAKTSSLHARKIQYFKRKGQPWVRFEFEKQKRPPLHGMPGVPRQLQTLELPVKRMVKIKQHAVDFVERPAVDVTFRLGEKTYTAEFTLTDRGAFIYPVLLGRRFLESAVIVDPSRIHVTGAPAALH